MRALYAFETGHFVAMKISTVPFEPFREASVCALPSASGNVKSGTIAPSETVAADFSSTPHAQLVFDAKAATVSESATRRARATSFFIVFQNSFREIQTGRAASLDEPASKFKAQGSKCDASPRSFTVNLQHAV